MYVAVGSQNPVKRDATEAAFEVMPGVSVEAVGVDSGVSDQPTGVRETAEGARTRARRAFAAGHYDLGVGIEGGVAEYEGVDGLYLIMWAAVHDGATTRTAGGPSIELPASVADRVRAGEELGPVMDDLLDEDEVAKKGGAAGAFTGGELDRTEALRTAVTGALGPFVTDHYED